VILLLPPSLRLTAAEFFGKQDPYVKVSLGTNWKFTSDPKMNGGSTVSWTGLKVSQGLTSAQLSRDELQVAVFDKNKSRSDVELGRGSVTARPVLSSPNTWVTMRGDLFSGKAAYGQFLVKGRFLVASSQAAKGPEIATGDHAVPSGGGGSAAGPGSSTTSDDLKKLMDLLSGQQSQVDRKVGGLEDTMKRQLQQELERERRSMEEMLSSQNQKLDDTLKRLSKVQLSAQPPPEPLKPWHGMSISEINAIKLPLNITTWRTAHVQAWLSLQLDLPQYIQSFYDSSIDGLVLLKHITAEVLEEAVGVTTPLHRLKILEGIESLRKRQSEYERKKRETQTPTPPPPVVEEAAQQKKTKRPKPKASQTLFGEVKEHNELERIRLERVLKEQRKEDKRRKKRAEEQQDLWRFEYTGGKKPAVAGEEVSNLLSVGHKTAPPVSSKYESMMKSIFETTDLLPSSAAEETLPPQTLNSLRVRQIPLDSPYDEVLTITRAAMFELSSRLLQIYFIEKVKELRQNADLNPTAGNRYGDDLIEQTMKRGAKESDEDLPPPLYTETEDDDVEEMEGPLDDSQLQAMVPPISRSQLIFSALINQKNNDARWLGPNSKLTRLKFYGGFESVLRLKISWPQFDALWTKLDYRRSGELDEEEFTTFFGDFEEFESPQQFAASRGLSTTQSSRLQNQSIDQFTAIMYEVCNLFRKHEFSILEIFQSFDRNGSGFVSISEFHSFLRTVLGSSAVSVKDIYRIFAYLDRDNSRTISCQEISMFVYLIWRSQLRELAYRISSLDVEIAEERELINRILSERNEIKEAVKKNFSREWRDYFERKSEEERDEAMCSGPFGHILKKLGVTMKGGGAGGADHQPRPPSPAQRGPGLGTSRSASGTRIAPKPPPPVARTRASGKNELLKYRIQSSRTQQIPSRKGAVLTVPVTHSLGLGSLSAEGDAVRFLQNTTPSANQVFAMTSQL
jgi:Ca2+-binding EF-hand superfamily protein